MENSFNSNDGKSTIGDLIG